MLPALDNTLDAAKNLLGWILVHDSQEGKTSGYIVETEAYMADDAASHSYKGSTPRTEVMFGPAAHLYVYFTYGMHYCVNIVTGKEGKGEAVLIRALQPIDGISLMRLRRGDVADEQLTNGPAKLAQAMGISRRHNGEALTGASVFKLLPGFMPNNISRSTRIGVTKDVDKPWRFYVTGNKYISRP